MRRIFVWGTLKSDGCNHPAFLNKATLVKSNFVFEDAYYNYMKFGEVWEVSKEDMEKIDNFETGFGYRKFYSAKYDFYYYLGAEVESSGRFVI